MNSSPDSAFVPEHLRHKINKQEQITRRDHFAGQALANAAICTGVANEWELKGWFGNQGGITRYQIAAKQALEYADALMTASNTSTGNNQ
jgi:hypothetical protein